MGLPHNEKEEKICFSGEEATKLYEMARLYDPVKAIILFGEEIAPHNITLPQILKELRDAFDHFMRVVAAKTGLKVGFDNKYLEINLDKAFSHVYRAAYDALDWVSIILRNKISVELAQYSAAAIQASIPDYYAIIRPTIESVIPAKIAEIRATKDIGAPDPKSIMEYADYVEELKKYWDAIVTAKPSLMDYSKREKKARVREWGIAFLIGAATAGLAMGLTVAFT